jgi:hypothetical protein
LSQAINCFVAIAVDEGGFDVFLTLLQSLSQRERLMGRNLRGFRLL